MVPDCHTSYTSKWHCEKTTRIKPGFNSSNTGNNRFVIELTHSNSKTFKGFINYQKAVTISREIVLEKLNNHPGTFFYRSENVALYIAYKLKEILEANSKYFWFDKEIRAENLDKISGQVVPPQMASDLEENEAEHVGHLFYGTT